MDAETSRGPRIENHKDTSPTHRAMPTAATASDKTLDVSAFPSRSPLAALVNSIEVIPGQIFQPRNEDDQAAKSSLKNVLVGCGMVASAVGMMILPSMIQGSDTVTLKSLQGLYGDMSSAQSYAYGIGYTALGILGVIKMQVGDIGISGLIRNGVDAIANFVSGKSESNLKPQ